MYRSEMVMRFLALVLLFLALGSPSHGASGRSDLDRIRDVVERQLSALKQGRSADAYRLASPEIRRQFPTAASFAQMLSASYAPLLHHRSFTFMDMQATPGGFAQGVRLVDAAGAAWTAIYTVRQQPDGAWAIAGCQIHPASAPGAR